MVFRRTLHFLSGVAPRGIGVNNFVGFSIAFSFPPRCHSHRARRCAPGGGRKRPGRFQSRRSGGPCSVRPRQLCRSPRRCPPPPRRACVGADQVLAQGHGLLRGMTVVVTVGNASTFPESAAHRTRRWCVQTFRSWGCSRCNGEFSCTACPVQTAESRPGTSGRTPEYSPSFSAERGGH